MAVALLAGNFGGLVGDYCSRDEGWMEVVRGGCEMVDCSGGGCGATLYRTKHI